jgi:holo-[acyl-carrier protein] synthase
MTNMSTTVPVDLFSAGQFATRLSERGVRVGIDVIGVAEVAQSMWRFGARYERRLFTEIERRDAVGTLAVRAASLAARFAAKEATLKILNNDGSVPAWRDIEVRRERGGHPRLHLHGEAARLARQTGLQDWSVSLTHSGGIAGAVVAAMVAEDHGGPPNDRET